MHVPFVDLKAQYQNHKQEIDSAISSVISETAFIRGKYVADFEKAFAESYGVKYCVACANGTDALFIVFKMLGIGPGDEVITTANSWIASSETISLTGARVVFVDLEDDYYNLDPSKIEALITPRTKAILPVHLLGQPAQMDAIMKIAKAHNLPVVEDCAQAHFAEFNGQRVGTFGIAATFSFYPGKNLGAYGDAGAIITNDDALAEKVRVFANHGADRKNKHDHVMEGINSRMDGLQAAILSAKLPHIAAWTAARKEKAAYYDALLKNVPQVTTPKIRPGATHVYHVYCIRVSQRDALQDFLKENGIDTSRHYPTILPLLQAYSYLGHTAADFPIAYQHSKEILSLPIYPEISDAQQQHVVDMIENFYSTYSPE
ncbi:MAG: DegT/DnrJ/EryC1/StrS family aminotransferase [Chthoniobacterales bacterium]